MSRKSLIIMGVVVIAVLNTVTMGSLYFLGVIWQPSQEELDAQQRALDEAEKAQADAIKYAHLEPLPEFKSRVGYVKSMGEAIHLCETTLNEKETAPKSWAVNYVESRYLPAKEIYMIFIDYETVVPAGQDAKIMKVTCDVDETSKAIVNWSAKKLE